MFNSEWSETEEDIFEQFKHLHFFSKLNILKNHCNLLKLRNLLII